MGAMNEYPAASNGELNLGSVINIGDLAARERKEMQIKYLFWFCVLSGISAQVPSLLFRYFVVSSLAFRMRSTTESQRAWFSLRARTAESRPWPSWVPSMESHEPFLSMMPASMAASMTEPV